MHQVLGQRFASAIYKSRQSARQSLQPEDHRIVEHGTRGQVAVSAEGRLRPGPEKQLVSMYPAAEVHDRLACHIAQAIGWLRL